MRPCLHRLWRVTRIWTASFVNRTPLLRFRPLQRSLAALRCPWLPCLRTIPLRRFATCRRPARPRKIACIASPLRFYAPRIRCGRARVRTFRRLRFRESQHASMHRLGRSKRPGQFAHNAAKSPIIRASESGESESLALANDPSRQATPLYQSAASCRVMHRRVPWRGVPLPMAQGFRGLVGRYIPSTFARQRSWGSTALRRFALAGGWPRLSATTGPTCRSRPLPAPD